MKVTAISVLSASVSTAQAQLRGKSSRKLGGAPPPQTRWDACVEQAMTASQCEAYILSSVNGDLSNHPIHDLEIVTHAQRDPVVVVKSNYMFGVPTTLFGEMDCNLNSGEVRFPFEWQAIDGQSYAIPNVPCAGLPALECCQAVKQSLIQQNIPLVNKDGHCFACRVHQELLQPRWDSASDSVKYAVYTYNTDTKTCKESLYSHSEVRAADAQTESKLIAIRALIHTLMVDPDGFVKCGDMIKAHNDVLLYGRSFPKASTAVAGLLCGQCIKGDPNEIIQLTQTQHEALQLLNSDLASEVDSVKNQIVIYTDLTGDKVLKVPMVGGSLNDSFNSNNDTRSGGDNPVSACPPGEQSDGQGGCMCLAVTDMADNKAFWTGDVKDTSATGCSCPSNLNEFNSRCFCPGGYKIWDNTLSKCVCPHGQNTDGSCICPGPNSGKDWNNVGWIKNSAGDSCKVDLDCTLSGYDYYTNFEDGCNRCRWGYVDDGYGNCVKPCDRTMGLVYDPSKDACICMYSDHQLINNKCQCDVQGATIPPGEVECQCTPPEVMQYDNSSQRWICRSGPPDFDDDNRGGYYGYKHYYVRE